MKKIFALALAALMTAGMTTVAFAAIGDVTPVVGINNAGGAFATNETAFVLNSDGKAVSCMVTPDDKIELAGGDQFAIPVMLWTDSATLGMDSSDGFQWYKPSNTAKTDGSAYDKSVYAYADWLVGEADVEIKLVNYDLDTTAAGSVGSSNTTYKGAGIDGRIWSVVVTLPENDSNKVAELAGKITVGSTKNNARTSDYEMELNMTYAPDATDANITTKFDGDAVLPTGYTGIVAFESDLGEIDIEFGDAAMFTVDVTGQSKLNLSWDTKFIKEFAENYDYANIDFLTFSGSPKFNKNGDFYIFADEDAFIYGVGEDNLAVALDAEWDADYDAWKIRTRELTSYAISDVELDEVTKTEDNTSSSTTDGGKENPDTGR